MYNGFGDKPSLLFAVGERIVAGGGAPEPSEERDLAAELLAEPDPRRRIEIVAAETRRVWEGGMLQFESMLLDAAASDPRAAEVASAAWQQKFEENRQLFALVFPEGSRRTDLDHDEALDLLFALDSAAFARILIEDRGWSYDQFERVLATTLERLFLGSSD